jgi:hypothetical protein
MKRRCIERDNEIKKRSARLLIGVSKQALQGKDAHLRKALTRAPIIV